MERKIFVTKGEVKSTPFSIVEFVLNPDKWVEIKNLFESSIKTYQLLKDFSKKHLNENFKNLIPGKECLDEIHIMQCEQSKPFQIESYYDSYEEYFHLFIRFPESKGLEEKKFYIEIKLKDVATKCKVTNTNELKKPFIEMLERASWGQGYLQGMIDRIDIDINVITDNRNFLNTKYSILDIQKIFFNYACDIVRNFPKYYHYIFPFKNYMLENHIIPTEEDMYGFIACLMREKKVEKTNLSTLENRVKRTHINHKKENIIPILPKFR